ncbi:MAG: DUF6252 family protein [Bacteroidota bacterium]|nr:DUF6252 family protein [Bacteroidota bacterium]
MKLRPVFFLFASLIFLLGSCTKELSRESPGASSLDSVNFYAVIDGTPWQGDSVQQVIVSDSGIMSITGIGKTQDEISILLPALQKGVFPVNSQTPGFALYTSLKEGFAGALYLSNTSTDASKAGGSVTITDIDTVKKTVSGTFQFNLYDESNASTKKVTAGFFNKIPYSGAGSVINPGGPPGGGTLSDTLSASVNDTVWVAAQVLAAAQNGVLIVSGTSANGQQALGLYMPVSVPAGTYTLNYTSGTYLATYDPDPLSFLVAQGNGSMTITENDTVNKHITGTFSFVGVSQLDPNQTATITNGYFSCSY